MELLPDRVSGELYIGAIAEGIPDDELLSS